MVSPGEQEVRRRGSCCWSRSDGGKVGIDRGKQTTIINLRVGVFEGYICVSRFAPPTETRDDMRQRSTTALVLRRSVVLRSRAYRVSVHFQASGQKVYYADSIELLYDPAAPTVWTSSESSRT